MTRVDKMCVALGVASAGILCVVAFFGPLEGWTLKAECPEVVDERSPLIYSSPISDDTRWYEIVQMKGVAAVRGSSTPYVLLYDAVSGEHRMASCSRARTFSLNQPLEYECDFGPQGDFVPSHITPIKLRFLPAATVALRVNKLEVLR
jgi:hypothetical protein